MIDKEKEYIKTVQILAKESDEPFKTAIETVLKLIQTKQEEIKNAYWKGYTARDVEAQNICKTCKYRAEKGKNMEEEIVKEKLQGIAKKSGCRTTRRIRIYCIDIYVWQTRTINVLFKCK